MQRGHSLAPQIHGGFSSGFAVAADVVAARDRGLCHGTSVNTAVGREVSRCATHFFGGDEALRIASAEVLSEMLNIEPMRLSMQTIRLASTFIGVDWGLRSWIDIVVTQSVPRIDMLRFFECASYDETPLSMRSSQPMSAALLAPASSEVMSEALAQAVGERSVALAQLPECNRAPRKARRCQKLAQAQVEYGCLFRVGGELVALRGYQVCPLAIVQRTTASALAYVQQRLSLAPSMVALFRRCTRVAVTDSYSAIVAAERHIAAARKSPMGANVHMKCQVHKTSTCHGLTFLSLNRISQVWFGVHWR